MRRVEFVQALFPALLLSLSACVTPHPGSNADALRDPRGGQLRRSTQQSRPEKEIAGLPERQPEPLQQPQRQQRVDDQSASEGIDAEQRREPHDDPTRGAERGLGTGFDGGSLNIELPIQPPHE